MKLQRLSIIAAVALGSFLVLATTGSAQDTNSTQRPNRRGPNIQQRVERLSTELKLNDDQKTKITALFEKQAKEGRELRDLSRDERRDKIRTVRQEQMKELKAILTTEQFEKWQQLREQNRGRRQGGNRRSGEPAPAPAPEPKNPDNKAP